MIGNTLLSLLMLALYAVHPLLLEAQTVAVCPLCPSLVLVGAVTWLVLDCIHMESHVRTRHQCMTTASCCAGSLQRSMQRIRISSSQTTRSHMRSCLSWVWRGRASLSPSRCFVQLCCSAMLLASLSRRKSALRLQQPGGSECGSIDVLAQVCIQLN